MYRHRIAIAAPRNLHLGFGSSSDGDANLDRMNATRNPRRLVVITAVAVLATAAVMHSEAEPPSSPRRSRSVPLRDGDLVFHESTSSQSAAIREVTGSRFTHMGLVFRRNGRWQVIEAVGPVRYTAFESWSARGRGGEVAVRRLREAFRLLDARAVTRLRTEAERFLGLPYDRLFEQSDRAIYCSELVFDAYERALGIRIGEPQPWSELDLHGPEARRLIRRRLRGHALEGEVITPARMMASPSLIAVE